MNHRNENFLLREQGALAAHVFLEPMVGLGNIVSETKSSSPTKKSGPDLDR